MKDALAIHQALLEDEIHHEIARLPRLVTCADELPAVLGVHRECCLAVRMYCAAGRRLVAVIVRAGEVPPEGVLRSVLGTSEIGPADTDFVNAVTDYAAGLVAPILLPACVTVFMDRRILDSPCDVVYAPTGDAGTAVGLGVARLFALSRAKPIDLTYEAAVAPSG